jgi:hypothetical protein
MESSLLSMHAITNIHQQRDKSVQILDVTSHNRHLCYIARLTTFNIIFTVE